MPSTDQDTTTPARRAYLRHRYLPPPSGRFPEICGTPPLAPELVVRIAPPPASDQAPRAALLAPGMARTRNLGGAWRDTISARLRLISAACLQRAALALDAAGRLLFFSIWCHMQTQH